MRSRKWSSASNAAASTPQSQRGPSGPASSPSPRFWPAVPSFSGRWTLARQPALPWLLKRDGSSRATRLHGGTRLSRPIRIPRTDRPLEQLAPITRAFPGFQAKPNAQGGLTWKGRLQPTPESPKYDVRVVHNPELQPRVYVDSHWLDPRCRHLYGTKQLCLYWPREWWWTAGESLPPTIIAWTALWLYFYELWLVTGKWLAPSSPHGVGPIG